MAGFTPEKRVAENRTSIPASGDRRSYGRDENRGPISGAPGAQAASVAGKGIAGRIDPAAEEAYWRASFKSEPYYERGYTYEDYYPAYRTGWEGRVRYEGRRFEQVERDLERDYARNRGRSELGWDKNRHAARAAWERFDSASDFERSQ